VTDIEIPPTDHVEAPLPTEISVFPLRTGVVYPYMPQQLTASRPFSVQAVETALESDGFIGTFAQREPGHDEPGPDDLYPIGTIAKIHKQWRVTDGSLRLIVQGISRAAIEEVIETKPFIRVRVRPLEDQVDLESVAVQAMRRNIQQQFQTMAKMMPHLPDELQIMVMNIDHPGRLADFVASNLDLQLEEHQRLLEELDVERRLEYLTELQTRELDIIQVGQNIQNQVQEKLGKSQREYFLREQLKQIQKELGKEDPQSAELQELRERLEESGLSEEATGAVDKELDRLEKMMPGAPEYSVARTYVDWMLDLPWSVTSEDHLDVAAAERILDEDHYGLEKIKDRVLENLAVRTLRREMKGQLLCFVGPPGVGKTSLGRSIARAMGRKFVRISLGGVRDEAEIRGHRRTYVGSMPGRIIQGLRKAGTNNPVFLLDEIDKVGADFRGDPAAALLEVLDPEQNSTFADHYLDVDYDLSKVMFITTANLAAPIPAPLRDRMEEIELSGYTSEEKVQIASRHLLPRQLSEHGIDATQMALSDAALRRLIDEYTLEAGLRNLDRELAALTRKVARKFVEGRQRQLRIAVDHLEKYLGPPPFFLEVAGREAAVGVATGLAATAAGGEILFIEATCMPGKRELTMTGQLGEVMQESAHAAMSYLRTHADELGIDCSRLEECDVHIHVPAGATPKEGPSAGTALATALLSLFTGRPVRPEVAMTGEITLRGRVLPVGGIRDKVLAAQRAGITKVILPGSNERDLADVPDSARRSMEFLLVDHIDEVVSMALLPAPRKRSPRAKTAAARGRGQKTARKAGSRQTKAATVRKRKR
jgi:ATP-dependent Lon protease